MGDSKLSINSQECDVKLIFGNEISIYCTIDAKLGCKVWEIVNAKMIHCLGRRKWLHVSCVCVCIMQCMFFCTETLYCSKYFIYSKFWHREIHIVLFFKWNIKLNWNWNPGIFITSGEYMHIWSEKICIWYRFQVYSASASSRFIYSNNFCANLLIIDYYECNVWGM